MVVGLTATREVWVRYSLLPRRFPSSQTLGGLHFLPWEGRGPCRLGISFHGTNFFDGLMQGRDIKSVLNFNNFPMGQAHSLRVSISLLLL